MTENFLIFKKNKQTKKKKKKNEKLLPRDI